MTRGNSPQTVYSGLVPMGTLDALPSRSGDNCGVRDSTSSKYWNFIVKSVHVLALWMPVGPRLARTEPTHWWSRSLVSWGWRWRSPLWLRLWRSATNPCTCPWRNVGHSRRSYIHPSEQNVPARRLLNACILTLFFLFYPQICRGRFVCRVRFWQ